MSAEELTIEDAERLLTGLELSVEEWKSYGHRSEKERMIIGVVILSKILNGASLRTIEREMGIPRMTVSRYRDKALSAIQTPTVDEARKVELERLESLAEAVWKTALTGDKEAIASYLKISERVSKLLGMDKPIQIEQTVHEITAQEAELQQLLAQAERDAAMQESKLMENADGIS